MYKGKEVRTVLTVGLPGMLSICNTLEGLLSSLKDPRITIMFEDGLLELAGASNKLHHRDRVEYYEGEYPNPGRIGFKVGPKYLTQYLNVLKGAGELELSFYGTGHACQMSDDSEVEHSVLMNPIDLKVEELD
jgi:hypothetical protein